MSALTLAAYTGLLNGRPLRFFKSPLPGPHFPWHATDDLHHCLELPRDVRRTFQRRLKSEWAKDVRTLATPEGICTIAPHFMAQGLISAMERAKGSPPLLEVAYTRQIGDAWKALMGDLPIAAGLALLLTAHRNEFGGDAA